MKFLSTKFLSSVNDYALHCSNIWLYRTIVVIFCVKLSLNTVFAQSDAAATVYFIAQVCAAFIRERRLLIPVAAREAIHREMVD